MPLIFILLVDIDDVRGLHDTIKAFFAERVATLGGVGCLGHQRLAADGALFLLRGGIGGL